MAWSSGGQLREVFFSFYIRLDIWIKKSVLIYWRTNFISHRLSSCKFCDEIAVFHEGAVIQQGSHADLLAACNGQYCELWNAQAQCYTE